MCISLFTEETLKVIIDKPDFDKWNTCSANSLIATLIDSSPESERRVLVNQLMGAFIAWRKTKPNYYNPCLEPMPMAEYYETIRDFINGGVSVEDIDFDELRKTCTVKEPLSLLRRVDKWFDSLSDNSRLFIAFAAGGIGGGLSVCVGLHIIAYMIANHPELAKSLLWNTGL